MTLDQLLASAQKKASQLHPYLNERAMKLVKLAYDNGFQIIITQGYRSIEEQNALYAQGRNGDSRPKVTNAKGGQSYHNYRLAFDIAVLLPNGDIDWNTDSKYTALGHLGESIGLEWGGSWNGFKDMPHFQYTYGLTWQDLMAGAKIPDYKKTEGKKNSMSGVTKERIYESNGQLTYVDPAQKGAYSIAATDVRFIKFDKNKVQLKLIWEPGAKVSDLVKKYSADYGINAPFFWQGSPVADCIAEGKILNQGYGNQTTWHGFAGKDGKVELGYFDVNGGYDFLIKTTPYLIDNGNLAWDYYRVQEKTAVDIGRDANGNYVRAQRTFIGIDANGDIIVAVSDGRTNSDRGLNLSEMALYMQDKGAINALNFDGGSSCVIADQSGMLNAQPDGEKAVGHALLIFFKKEAPQPAPAPVQVVSAPTPAPVDWKQEGFDYLVKNYGIDPSQWNPTSPVDMGTLGTLIKRKDEKK